jgi:hypothetical protein
MQIKKVCDWLVGIVLGILIIILFLTTFGCSEVRAERLNQEDLKVYPSELSALELPYDLALTMPMGLYYWWAKAQNEKAYASVPHIVDNSGAVRIRENMSVIGREPSNNYFNYNNKTIETNTNKQTDTLREDFYPPQNTGPIMIYNPYVR